MVYYSLRKFVKKFGKYDNINLFYNVSVLQVYINSADDSLGNSRMIMFIELYQLENLISTIDVTQIITPFFPFILVIKEEPVQIQIDEQAQLTIVSILLNILSDLIELLRICRPHCKKPLDTLQYTWLMSLIFVDILTFHRKRPRTRC